MKMELHIEEILDIMSSILPTLFEQFRIYRIMLFFNQSLQFFDLLLWQFKWPFELSWTLVEGISVALRIVQFLSKHNWESWELCIVYFVKIVAVLHWYIYLDNKLM